jgi:WD40 repeat protein
LALAKSNNSQLLAVASRNIVSIYETKTFNLLTHIKYPKTRIQDIAFSSDDLSLALSHLPVYGGTTHEFYDVATGQKEDLVLPATYDGTPYSENGIWRFEDDTNRFSYRIVNTVSSAIIEFPSPLYTDAIHRLTNQKLISVLAYIEEWDIATQIRLQQSKASFGIHGGIVFSPDSRFMIDNFTVWDMSNGTSVDRLSTEALSNLWEIMSVHYHPNGHPVQLAMGEKDVFKIIDLQTSEVIQEMSIKLDDRGFVPPDSFVMLPDWQRMVTGCRYVDYGLQLWNLETGDNKLIWKNGDDATEAFDISHDGRYLAAITSERTNSTVFRTLRIFDLKTFDEVFTLDPAWRATFVPGQYILFVSSRGPEKDGRVEIWDFLNNKLMGSVPEFTPYQNHLTFSSDRDLVFVPQRNILEVWNWRQQKKVREIQITENTDETYLLSGIVSPDGRLYVSIADNHKGLSVWGIPKT